MILKSLSKHMNRFFLAVLLLTLPLAGIGTAAILDYDFTIQYINGSNPYGLDYGDTVTATVNFDPAQGDTSATGLSMHNSWNDPGNPSFDSDFSISLNFGSATFLGTSDPLFPYFPAVTFNTNGSSDGTGWTFNVIDFYASSDPGDSNSYWISIRIPDINDPIALNAGGIQDQEPWELSSVPEPATLVLFGIGLLGLAGMGRKQ